MIAFTDPKLIKKAWGYELWLANNERYCGKKLVIEKGWQCSLHHHKIKHETFHLLNGRLTMEYGGQRFVMNPGDTLVIEPGTKHRFRGLQDSTIIEFSTFHDDNDVYRDEDSCFVGDANAAKLR